MWNRFVWTLLVALPGATALAQPVAPLVAPPVPAPHVLGEPRLCVLALYWRCPCGPGACVEPFWPYSTPVAAPVAPVPPPKVPVGANDPSHTVVTELAGSNFGRLVVNLPTGARLSIDGQTLTGTVEQRSFRTPELRGNESYSYTLRADFERDGQPVSETRRVTLRPGVMLTTTFADPPTAIAQTNGR